MLMCQTLWWYANSTLVSIVFFSGEHETWPEGMPWSGSGKGIKSYNRGAFSLLWEFIICHERVDWRWLTRTWHIKGPKNSLDMADSLRKKADLDEVAGEQANCQLETPPAPPLEQLTPAPEELSLHHQPLHQVPQQQLQHEQAQLLLPQQAFQQAPQQPMLRDQVLQTHLVPAPTSQRG
jgi:hypothetical protein